MKKVFLLLVMGLFGITLFAQNQFEVSFKDLPKDIQKYVTKNYAGFKVDKAIQQDSKKGKVDYYDVYVSKGTDKTILTFDKKDEFVKATPVAAAVAPVAAPVTVAPPIPKPAAVDTTKRK